DLQLHMLNEVAWDHNAMPGFKVFHNPIKDQFVALSLFGKKLTHIREASTTGELALCCNASRYGYHLGVQLFCLNIRLDGTNDIVEQNFLLVLAINRTSTADLHAHTQ